MTEASPIFGRIYPRIQTIFQTEVWIISGLTIASMAAPDLLPAAVIMAAIFWPLRKLATGRLTIWRKADLPILLLLSMSLVSLVVTPLPSLTRLQTLRLWSGVAWYYALVNGCNTRLKLRWMMGGLLLGGLALALVSPMSVEWPAGKLPFIPEEFYQWFKLAVADSIHPNVFAGTLILLIPIAMAQFAFAARKTTWLSVISGVSAIAMGGALLLSLSRSAILALAAAIVALLILRGRSGWLALALALLAGGLAVLRLGVYKILSLFMASASLGGYSSRMDIWSRAFYILQDFPFTGVGMGAFPTIADRLYPFTYFDPGWIHHAHNLYLQIAVDLGVVGLLAWLAIFTLATVAAWRAYRLGLRAQDHLLTAVGAGLFGSQLALGLHGLTDAVIWGMVRPAPLVWALWGVGMAASRIAKNVPSDRPG
ncbi:MAG: O-antigen ligase family protein [Anaerolineales bacterium]|nr:O-antigen ligase family protein [Anaerolineales bacterium]